VALISRKLPVGQHWTVSPLTPTGVPRYSATKAGKTIDYIGGHPDRPTDEMKQPENKTNVLRDQETVNLQESGLTG